MRLVILLILLLSGFTALAKEAEPMEDPAIEGRFKHLTSELRCLKCQNQTIYDSKAGLADDLRKQIRNQLHAGKTDAEIVDYMVARYGDFIRYRPSTSGKNIFLWIGPGIFMLAGFTILYFQLRKRRSKIVDTPLNDEENQRVSALIKNKVGEKG